MIGQSKRRDAPIFMYDLKQFCIASYMRKIVQKSVCLSSSVCVYKKSSTISYTKSLYEMTYVFLVYFVRNDLAVIANPRLSRSTTLLLGNMIFQNCLPNSLINLQPPN